MKGIKWTVKTRGSRSEFVLPAPCRLFTIGRDRTDIPVYSPESVKIRCLIEDDDISVKGEAGTQIALNGETSDSVKVEESSELEVFGKSGAHCFTLEIEMLDNVQQPVPDRRIELMPGSYTFGSKEDCAVLVPTVVPDRIAFSLIRN